MSCIIIYLSSFFEDRPVKRWIISCIFRNRIQCLGNYVPWDFGMRMLSFRLESWDARLQALFPGSYFVGTKTAACWEIAIIQSHNLLISWSIYISRTLDTTNILAIASESTLDLGLIHTAGVSFPSYFLYWLIITGSSLE